jgi:putative transposase
LNFSTFVRHGSILKLMPRAVREFIDGGLYHVLNRGNGRSRIFYKDRDFLAFLRVLVEGLSRFNVDLLCWCLMNNHCAPGW